MSSTLPQLYCRKLIVDSVFESILDRKYSGLPVANMKIGSRVWLNAMPVTFKTFAVTDVLEHIAEMLDTYDVVILLRVLLTVVMRLSW